MKNQVTSILILIIPVLFSLGIQIYMMKTLNRQIGLLNHHVNRAAIAHMGLANRPGVFHPGCEAPSSGKDYGSV